MWIMPSWLIVLAVQGPSWIFACLFMVVKSPALEVDLSVSLFSFISVCLMHFDTLLGAQLLRVGYVFLENWPLCYYIMSLFIPKHFACSDVGLSKINEANSAFFDLCLYCVTFCILLKCFYWDKFHTKFITLKPSVERFSIYSHYCFTISIIWFQNISIIPKWHLSLSAINPSSPLPLSPGKH